VATERSRAVSRSACFSPWCRSRLPGPLRPVPAPGRGTVAPRVSSFLGGAHRLPGWPSLAYTLVGERGPVPAAVDRPTVGDPGDDPGGACVLLVPVPRSAVALPVWLNRGGRFSPVRTSGRRGAVPRFLGSCCTQRPARRFLTNTYSTHACSLADYIAAAGLPHPYRGDSCPPPGKELLRHLPLRKPYLPPPSSARPPTGGACRTWWAPGAGCCPTCAHRELGAGLDTRPVGRPKRNDTAAAAGSASTCRGGASSVLLLAVLRTRRQLLCRHFPWRGHMSGHPWVLSIFLDFAFYDLVTAPSSSTSLICSRSHHQSSTFGSPMLALPPSLTRFQWLKRLRRLINDPAVVCLTTSCGQCDHCPTPRTCFPLFPALCFTTQRPCFRLVYQVPFRNGRPTWLPVVGAAPDWSAPVLGLDCLRGPHWLVPRPFGQPEESYLDDGGEEVLTSTHRCCGGRSRCGGHLRLQRARQPAADRVTGCNVRLSPMRTCLGPSTTPPDGTVSWADRLPP